jgi:hypothetical protein
MKLPTRCSKLPVANSKQHMVAISRLGAMLTFRSVFGSIDPRVSAINRNASLYGLGL